MKYKSEYIIFSMTLFLISYSTLTATEVFQASQLITKDQIQSSGITRLSDIFTLMDNWYSFTIDGYRWQTSANGLSFYQGQDWILMLDGQRIDIEYLDDKSLNVLPITLEQIDSVEIISSPQIHLGEFSGSGLIHIHTSQPKRGISFHGRYSTGNETGDPGPYKYTEFTSPNIDEIGPDYGFGLKYGSKEWNSSLGLKIHFHPSTDVAIERRRGDFKQEFMRVRMYGGSFRLAKKTDTGSHNFFVGYTTSEPPSFVPKPGSDLLFFKPVGTEIPVQSNFSHVGFNGEFNFRSINVYYRFKHSISRLKKPEDFEGLDFDWEMQSYYGNLEIDFLMKNIKSKSGIGLNRKILKTRYSLSGDSFDLYKVYNQLEYRTHPNLTYGLDLFFVFNENQIAFKSAIKNLWRLNPNHCFDTSLSFSQRLFEEDNSFWFWVEKGYEILERHELNYQVNGKFNESKKLTFDLSWNYHRNRWEIEATSGYRKFLGLHSERQQYQFDPQLFTFHSPSIVHTNVDGQSILGGISISHQVGETFQHKINYQLNTEIGGDSEFEESWKVFPEHKIQYISDFAPVPNFSLWGMITYLSSSHWNEYKRIDSQSNGIYSHKVNSVFLLDLAAQKLFWQRRIRTNLLFRNILNQDHHVHPIGADFNLRFYFKIEVLFDSII